MIKGPFLILYFLFLAFPTPGLIFLVLIIVSSSSPQPRAYKMLNKSLVLETCKESTTNGISGTSLILCPLAQTSEGTAEAAIAEATACLL